MICEEEGDGQQLNLRNLTMKESQGVIGIDPAPLTGTELQRFERSSPFPSRDSGHSLLLLQLRTELEGKWRPDKFGILRKWMHASPKHWKEDAYENAIRPGFIIHNGKKRNGHKRVRRKKAAILPKPKPAFMERFGQQVAPSEENEKVVDCAGDSEVPSEKNQRRAQRFLLEEEVMVLQKQLQKEVDLHLALANAINLSSGARPQLPQDIPTSARGLLEDIAALENVVDALEDEAIDLQGRIGHERKERESLERNGSLPKDRHVTEESRSVSRSQTKLSVVKSRKPSEKILASKPVTLQDHLRGASVTNDSSGDLRVLTPRSLSKLPLSEKPRPVPLSWNSRVSDSTSTQESVNSSLSSDCSSQHGYPSRLDSHHCGHFSAALQAEPATLPSTFSPARISFSGASTCDQSGSSGESGALEQSGPLEQTGSLGPPSGSLSLSSGPEQDLCTSSQLVSDVFPIPTSPSTPEHRVRPTSPAGASVGMLHFRDDGALSTEDMPFLEISKRMGEPREGKYSLSKRNIFGTEEFFTPTNSISSFGDPLGDSQPSSTEKVKVRSKVRVKLNWEPLENQTKLNTASPDRDSYDAEYIKHRKLVYNNVLTSGILPPVGMHPLGSKLGGHYKGRDYSKTPNQLSEEMMDCMIGIYRHSADPAVTPRNQYSYDSPISHFGHTDLLSGFSMFSDHSMMSFVRSPLVDLRTKDDILGCDSSPNPFSTRGRIPWADIGIYGRVLEVPSMSPRSDKLGHASQALNKFRFLAEQLSKVDPVKMSHSQKLAFWVNIYNSLMMHALLMSGVPQNELKYFALIQKAAFNVGGHSFNAATIEYSLLKGKVPFYRPQLGLLVALHRNKWSLAEDQSKFAIDHPEPQMIFSLCCGARSSPAVRVYTAGKVHKEINMALRDYARATVGLNVKGKLLVPKLLYFYAHDFIDDANILDWVCQFLPTIQVGLVRECWQHRQNRLLGTKSFAVMPFELNFRYLFALRNSHIYNQVIVVPYQAGMENHLQFPFDLTMLFCNPGHHRSPLSLDLSDLLKNLAYIHGRVGKISAVEVQLWRARSISSAEKDQLSLLSYDVP